MHRESNLNTVTERPLIYQAKTKKRWLNSERKEGLTFYLLISPWLLGFLFFILGPMIASLYISFTDWDLLTPAKWTGLDNYVKAFTGDPLFWQALKVTMIYSLFSVPIGLIVSLGVAMLLNQAVRGMSIFRTIYYLPAVVSGVSVMVLWMYIFNPQIGLLNTVLGYFGIKGPGWIFDPKWALLSIVIMSLWGVGGGIIIWLAGLNGIPDYLYEAADLDGASKFQKFMHITVPMLTPTIFFNLITGIIGALQTFGEAYVMTKGGPLNSTLFFNYYLFRKAFEEFDMGYASALAWILFIIIFIFTLLVFRSSALWVHYEGEKR
ncbi:sugar ABC transporter permease [Fictibacillus sp. WQ 8-8]|uniref:carbohydrate ABC transporter permease n=1 Tax=unclassified Fictibacillus TaxID=2644029 RepID=UPI00210D9233|nr:MULTISPECIES: sugar ABC transporter permease [unclassified Fictibacillus]MCQ6267928.1 sugar ABC transporter permease [Fictibacillus sp. WQ 8-8]MED2974405.1 sugar ABC transporter permease [Fictibacillus sp. B-59209]